MNKQKDFAVLGGILFLLPGLTGVLRFIRVDRFGPEDVVIGSFMSTLLLVVLGGGLTGYGLIGRKKTNT